MIVTCSKCDARFDDEYRTTICPHETFAANDGQNNFAHHPEAYLSRPTAVTDARPDRRQAGLDTQRGTPPLSSIPESEPPAGAGEKTPGEDAWLIEFANCGGSRARMRTVLRAYRANLLSQATRATPVSTEEGRSDERFDAHTKAVAEFLNELYAIMVDPCADGSIKVADMQKALIEAAKRDREYSHFATYYHVEATARLSLERWRSKPHNAKWWKRIDGTPIPNDLIVCISEDIAKALRAALATAVAETQEGKP